MKKRISSIIVFSAIVFTLSFGAVQAAETIGWIERSPQSGHQYEVSKVNHRQELQIQKEAIASIAEKEHQISLEDYRLVQDDALVETINSDQGLSQVFYEALRSLEPGDHKPILYLGDDGQGYMVIGKANEQTIVHPLEHSTDGWTAGAPLSK